VDAEAALVRVSQTMTSRLPVAATRQRERTRQQARAALAGVAPLTDDDLGALAWNGPGPDDRAELTDRDRAVAAAVAGLPAGEREVIEGRFGLGGREPRFFAELGAAQGKTCSATSRRWRLARERLREALAGVGA
jgi:DNA-directed RNA polymerase specialized sigma24 family protein